MSTTEAIDPRIEERAAALAAAREEQRLAQLRVQAAAEIAAEEAETEHQRRVEQFVAELPGRISTAPVEVAEKKMAAAISAYVAACCQRSEVFSEAFSFIQAEDGGALVSGHSMTVGDQTWRFDEAKPNRGITAAAKAAIREHFGPRASTQLDWG